MTKKVGSAKTEAVLKVISSERVSIDGEDKIKIVYSDGSIKYFGI